jgi:L-threonylcarbamoyladenylate synthase
MTDEYRHIQHILKNDGVAVIPTDTIYGLVGRAFSKRAVSRIYEIKGRDDGKPCIILTTRLAQLQDFGVTLSPEQHTFLSQVWPGKVSVILPCTKKSLQYLHRGNESLAFRMVGTRNLNLHRLIETVGPLVAPSANLQGQSPAKNRREARAYFGERVDGYVCGGTRVAMPSTLVSLLGTKPQILRQGGVQIPDSQ